MKTEVKEKRKLNQKHFLNDDGIFTMEAHAGHIHYDNKLKKGDGGEGFRSIDMTLVWNEVRRGWEFEFHNFNPFIPEYADEWADFRDLFDKKDQTISYQPKCSHVKGRLVPSIEGVTNINAVIYDDAFGEGFDLIYYFTRSQMLKVVRIRDGFKPTEDVSFDFGVKFSDPTMKVIRSFDDGNEYELDITKPKTFDSARKTKIKKRDLIGDEKEPNTFLKEFKVWDSNIEPGGKKTQIIEVDLIVDETGVTFRKHIPAAFFVGSIGDVFTDTTTSYYPGAGDGHVQHQGTSGWSTIRNAATGSNVSVTDTTLNPIYWSNGSLLQIFRGFLPIDTSGLPSGAVISDADLYLYANGYNTNLYLPRTDEMDIVDATQASISTLTTADYDQVNTTVYGSRIVTHWPSNSTGSKAWGTIPLTDFGIINKGGTTKIGLRWDDDTNNNDISGITLNRGLLGVETSESANDPYIEVTYTVAADQNSAFLAFM